MAPFASIYGFEGNPRTIAPRVVAVYEGIDLEKIETNPFQEGGPGAEYLKLAPLGLTPALKKDDWVLTESTAITTYLASINNKAGLLGATKEDAASIQQWLAWANFSFLAGCGAHTKFLTGAVPYNKSASEQAKAALFKQAKYVDSYLANKTFLVGERISVADIFLAAAFVRGAEKVLDAAFRKEFINLTRHANTVIRQPQYLSVIGTAPVFIEKSIVYTPPKKEPAPKKEAPAAAPKAKAAPKPAADEEEEEAPAAPKPKHPGEALGAAKSFPLDEFKRQYSNNDVAVSFKWLEDNFDAQDYSLWKVSYKYPEELTQTFMSANLITGFHNRLEGSRKYLFGSAGVYGKTNDSLITGAYLLRGADYKQVFDVAPDYESYNYEPLDLKKDRDFILGAFSWEHEVDGKPYVDGKVFK